MSGVQRRLYSAAQVREIEHRAIEKLRVPGLQLMRRAAAAAWGDLRISWPKARVIGVVCGPGNNGGDGYELARLAKAARREVRVWQLGVPPNSGDALTTCKGWLKAGGKIVPWSTTISFDDCDVLVDALFGIGLSRPLEGAALAAVHVINAATTAKLALDIPSGLNADTGAAMGACVRADRTATFIGYKSGLFQGAAADAVGRLQLYTLDLPAKAYTGTDHDAELLDGGELKDALPRRRRAAHKGDHGHVLVMGGDHGMMGAALLAGRAALRAGAGLVSVATRQAHVAAMTGAQPELMCRGVEDAREIGPMLEAATVIALGPGLGQTNWGRALFAQALSAKKPLVVDADGLNWLAQNPMRREDWVLTPHPGEASRLLDTDTLRIQADRFAAAQSLQERYGGIVALKGAGTVICDGNLSVCPHGNPGMAVGGMGDVLAGVIAALLAQGLTAAQATQAGVLAHALAGDEAARAGERGLLPSDLLPLLRKYLNP
ncbi:MAG: NAD(P)H-hydrate dehydratase [Pseudomonadota bacterium]